MNTSAMPTQPLILILRSVQPQICRVLLRGAPSNEGHELTELPQSGFLGFTQSGFLGVIVTSPDQEIMFSGFAR